MMSLTRGLQSLQKQVDVQTNVEIPSAALTLTRSATLAITTAGTVITWQVETRNQGFTWSGTTITIPTAGYYAVQLALGTTGSQTMAFTRIVNGTTIGGFVGLFSATNYFSGQATAYYATGDALQIRLVPGANTTVTQVAEFAATESPILHIVQLSGSV
jgi:hypothetical protein